MLYHKRASWTKHFERSHPKTRIPTSALIYFLPNLHISADTDLPMVIVMLMAKKIRVWCVLMFMVEKKDDKIGEHWDHRPAAAMCPCSKQPSRHPCPLSPSPPPPWFGPQTYIDHVDHGDLPHHHHQNDDINRSPRDSSYNPTSQPQAPTKLLLNHLCKPTNGKHKTSWQSIWSKYLKRLYNQPGAFAGQGDPMARLESGPSVEAAVAW